MLSQRRSVIHLNTASTVRVISLPKAKSGWAVLRLCS
jgi:hypothetical protein